MPDTICDTSPFHYLHLLGLLDILPRLSGRIVAPQAVVAELAAGRARGFDVPDPEHLPWVDIRRPLSIATLAAVDGLGPGETEVLALALERKDSLAILDDGLARHVAERFRLHFTGTLGLLLDAKRIGRIPFLAPLIERLQALGFRLSLKTRNAVLRLAGET